MPADVDKRARPPFRRDPLDDLLEELALRLVEDERTDRTSPHPLDELVSALIARDRELLRESESAARERRAANERRTSRSRTSRRGSRRLSPNRGSAAAAEAAARAARSSAAGHEAARGRVFGFLLAFAMPAAAAAALASAILPPVEERHDGQSAASLAQLADAPELRPIVLRDGRGQLASRAQLPVVHGPRPGEPSTIAIPAADLQADVEPVHQVEDGIEVPDVGRAGWFAAGARPGEPGRSVIVGHLDTRKGPGLFAKLPSLPNGALVSVTDADGNSHRYSVIGRTAVEKSRFPADAVYGNSRRSVLVLITCGGPWDEDSGYRDNVIVYARAI